MYVGGDFEFAEQYSAVSELVDAVIADLDWFDSEDGRQVKLQCWLLPVPENTLVERRQRYLDDREKGAPEDPFWLAPGVVWTVFLEIDDSLSVYFDVSLLRPWVLVELVDGLQDSVIEAARSARPRCPIHDTHPLRAGVIGDQPMWECPLDAEAWRSTVGEFATDRSG